MQEVQGAQQARRGEMQEMRVQVAAAEEEGDPREEVTEVLFQKGLLSRSAERERATKRPKRKEIRAKK